MTGAVLFNWAIALLPVLAMLVVFEWLDVFHLMGWREMTGVLALGALAGLSAYPVSGRLLDTLPMGFSTYSRYAAPAIEEALKGAAIIVLFARNRLGFRLDALISGFAVGAGFSVVENLFYLWRFDHLDAGVWLVRGLGTASMHGVTGALFAVAAQRIGEREARRPAARWGLHPAQYVPGYAAAVAVHTLFNTFPDRPLLAMLTSFVGGPILILLAMRLGERAAAVSIQLEEAAHRSALADLAAGNFPATPTGAIVELLARRIGGRAPAEAVRDFFAAQTEIVLRAEEALRARAGGDRDVIGPTDAALFDRRRTLERALGRTTTAILSEILPFSQHEWWEASELEAMTRAAGRRS